MVSSLCQELFTWTFLFLFCVFVLYNKDTPFAPSPVSVQHHFHRVINVSRLPHPVRFSSTTAGLWNSHPCGCFPITTILTSSNQVSIFICPFFPHNILFLTHNISFVSHVMVIFCNVSLFNFQIWSQGVKIGFGFWILRHVLIVCLIICFGLGTGLG